MTDLLQHCNQLTSWLLCKRGAEGLNYRVNCIRTSLYRHMPLPLQAGNLYEPKREGGCVRVLLQSQNRLCFWVRTERVVLKSKWPFWYLYQLETGFKAKRQKEVQCTIVNTPAARAFLHVASHSLVQGRSLYLERNCYKNTKTLLSS